MTPVDGARLAALRRDLDEIDDALHDGLRRRADMVRALAASGAKSGVALRPGREAAILRRLCARDPAMGQVTVRVWREIFAGSIALQGPLRIAVCGEGLLPLAREHFGALTPMRVEVTPLAALASVQDGASTAAILPLPRPDEPPEAAWWTALRRPPCVIAKIPFWAARPDGGPGALVVAASRPDPSGEDAGLLGLALPRGTTPAALAAAMRAAGFAAHATWRHADAAMVQVTGLVADDDPRLAELGATATATCVLGGYAMPLRTP